MTREAPTGFVIVDLDRWVKCHLSDHAISGLIDSQLAKIGLMREAAWREQNGQEAMDL